MILSLRKVDLFALGTSIVFIQGPLIVRKHTTAKEVIGFL